MLKNVSTITLLDTTNMKQPVGGDNVIVLGWGDTNVSTNVQDFSTTLQKATLTVVDNKACDAVVGSYGGKSVSYKGFIGESMLCAKHNKRDACQGDSGEWYNI